MKGMTISRKLLLIFFVNVLVIGCIAGIVFYSFQGLSGTITYSSKTLGDYKADLDTLRVQQSQLEGLTQPFYLNVTSLSAEKARADFNRFVQKLIFNIEVLHTAKYDSVNALQTHRAAIISETYGVSQSVLKDASNSLAGELDSIENK